MASILLVDDEPAFRDIFQRYLEFKGYTVVTAGNGAEALRVFETQSDPIRMVVLDLILPQEDSREIAAQMKMHNPGLPILYVSASRHHQVLDNGLLDARDVFLENPFSLIVLKQTVQRILDRNPS
ncbi:MAG: response regulator [candidate division Zixibacteria bacterium]|nr:response regulator [candidate division Zixibacteria bacterium]